MGIVVKQSLKSTVISYLGVLIGFANTILIFPKILSLEEIGLFKVMLSCCIILMPLVQFNATAVVTKFFPFFNKDELLRNSFLSKMLLLPMIGMSILALCFWAFGDGVFGWLFEEKSPLILTYSTYILPLVFFFVFANLLESILFSHLKSVLATFLKTVLVRLLTLLIVLLYHFSFVDQDGMMKLFVGVYGVQFFLLLVYFLRLSNFKITSPSIVAKSEHGRSIFSYLSIIFLGGGGAVVVSQIDSIMSSNKLGLDYTGIYTIAFFIAVVIEIPRRSIIQIVAPLLTKAVKEDDLTEIKNIYKKTAINQFVASGVAYALIITSLLDIYNFIPGNDNYYDVIKGMPVVMIVGLSYVFDMLMGCNTEIIHYSRLYKWNAVLIPLLAFLAISLNLLFLELLDNGLIAIAAATFATIFTHNLIRCGIIYKYYKLTPFSLGHLKFFLLFILALAIGRFLPDFGNKYVNILANSLVIATILLGGALVTKVSTDLNRIAGTIVKRFKKP